MHRPLLTVLYLLTITSFSVFAQAKQPSPLVRSHTPASKQTLDRKADEENIREAVYRSQIRHSVGGVCKVIFLAVGDQKSTSSALMARFASNPIPVKPFSRAVVRDRLYKDRKTNQQGILYFVRKINRIDAMRCTVDCGWMNGRCGGVYSLYTVQKSKGKWSVTSKKDIGEY